MTAVSALAYARRCGTAWTRVCVVALALVAYGAATAAPCDPPVTNPIACENTKPGNPSSEWDLPAPNAGDSTIQGFATDISYVTGQTVSFKVKTTATAYRIDIYRLGYYNTMGARKIATVNPSVSLPQSQPACITQSSIGLIDCGNWAQSATWTIPSTAVTGVYVAKLVRTDTGGSSHMVFVIRDDTSHSDLLLQASDSTWVAYNMYGGTSLYRDHTFSLPQARAYKVSYNRPFNTRNGINGDSSSDPSWVFDSEYPMIRFLEANGYNVSYTTNMDTARRPSEILEHKVFISSGHDEYWSASQRTAVENARAAGVHLAFFSGNEVFWKTRWENSVDGTNTPNRTLTCYKETHANAVIDPQDPPTWGGTWRDPRFSPPADGGRPENALTGQLFMVNGPVLNTITVPAEFGPMRFWRNTAIATLPAGQTATLTTGSLGYEWDEEPDNGFRPPGLFRLSTTTLNVSTYLLDYGTNYGNGTATHGLSLYRYGAGALVFGAGTTRWAWGLDATHDNGPSTTNASMRQAMVNLLADMGAQPSTLQPPLVAATSSTDFVAPHAIIVSPADGASVSGASAITISGTASDSGGGAVAAVEVSTDGGTTWHRATGRQNWTYPYNTASIGAVNVRARAVDDSGNLESAGPGITINVTSLVVTFDDIPANQDLDGIYPTSEIDWGTGDWFASGPWGGFTTNSTSFNGPGVTSESFTFLHPRRLISLVAYNGAAAANTVMINCPGNPNRNFSVNPGEVKTLSLNWSATCTSVTIQSGNGWDTNFDNITYDTGNACVGVVCTASDACHVAGTCNPATGACSNPTAPNGTTCNDGNATTCSDTCNAGVCAGTFVAQPPEVGSSVQLDHSVVPATISWNDPPGPYNLYRGIIDTAGSWSYDQVCLAPGISASSVTIPEDPPAGSFYYYLLSRVAQCRESVIGRDGTGAAIPNTAACP